MLRGKNLSVLLLLLLFIAVIMSVVYSNTIAHELAIEEQKRMELWAQATTLFITAEDDTDIDFYTSIIENNTTIPVYITDSLGNILISRNVSSAVKDPRRLHGPIEVHISDDNTQYIWYDDSTPLQKLYYFPYLQLLLILTFVFLIIVTLYMAYNSERNRVWIGLCKETAHQLGTPISSLNAWSELLHSTYPDEPMLMNMDADIQRLNTITDRFSKVGSVPELSMQPLLPILESTIAYMRKRLSDNVSLQFTNNSNTDIQLPICAPLFSWVGENIIKNAVDARATHIDIVLSIKSGQKIIIDIHDDGKGMSKWQQRRVFDPGYTTKKRGWGLGLSMSKRIIEEYHGGKLFVKSSEQGRGTIFRIVLKQSEHS